MAETQGGFKAGPSANTEASFRPLPAAFAMAAASFGASQGSGISSLLGELNARHEGAQSDGQG